MQANGQEHEALRRDPGGQGLRPSGYRVGHEMAYDAEACLHRWLGRGKTLAKGGSPAGKRARGRRRSPGAPRQRRRLTRSTSRLGGLTLPGTAVARPALTASGCGDGGGQGATGRRREIRGTISEGAPAEESREEAEEDGAEDRGRDERGGSPTLRAFSRGPPLGGPAGGGGALAEGCG